MNGNQAGPGRSWLVRALMSGAFVAVFACSANDAVSPTAGPTSTAPGVGDSVGAPVDSTALPVDSTALPVDSTLPADSSATTPEDSSALTATLATGTQPGIVFGSYGMRPEALNTIHTGTMVGGPITPSNVISWLTAIRAKGGRVVLKMCKGGDGYVKTDGVFDIKKWKALVDGYRSVNLGPFISDGTLMGHFLIDEPQRSAKWGKVISQATVESMAAYSKSIWPTLTTFVRVVPSWLASAPPTVTYHALDAGWLQYAAGKGDAATVAAAEVAAAKAKGLGLMMALHVLDGGNGSSGVPGWSKGKWAMSATEIRNYGTALLNQTYACGFFNWMYQDMGISYWARSDIKSAMSALSTKAKAHVRTSCQQ